MGLKSVSLGFCRVFAGTILMKVHAFFKRETFIILWFNVLLSFMRWTADQMLNTERPTEVFLLLCVNVKYCSCVSSQGSLNCTERRPIWTEQSVCTHALSHYTSPSVSSRLSEAAFCNHIWLKREQSVRCETWLFIVILIHQREDGKGLRKAKKRKTWAQRCYQEGNKRAIRLCSLDTRKRGRGVLSRSIKNLHWPNLAMTGVCNVVCLSGWTRKEFNQ